MTFPFMAQFHALQEAIVTLKAQVAELQARVDALEKGKQETDGRRTLTLGNRRG